MKSTIALVLMTASFAQFALANDPAIPPASRDRFLNGVHDFAGGKLTLGAPAYLQPGNPSAGGNAAAAPSSNSAPASWRSPDGRVTNGTIVRSTITPNNLVGQQIVPQNIAPQQIAPQTIVSPWRR